MAGEDIPDTIIVRPIVNPDPKIIIIKKDPPKIPR